ncbi:MAG: MATE family efflux transporter, partial [Oscillospiraceae bacterium]|nr:MATE family efflux transporter [Oscillospiraceae bacterium]
MARTGDMTQGTEWKQLLLFSLPLMVGNILQQLYNTVDGIIVGNFVSEDALAAVGTCAPLTMLFVALAIGMSNGSAIVVAQLFGAKRYEDMRRAVSTSMIILIGMGLLLSVVGVSASRPLLVYGLNVNRLYLDYAVSYFSIYACGLVFQFTYNICSAILRSLGDSKATLYFLLVSSVTNILLDMLFVIAFRWGVTGAAIATVISQALSAAVALVYMLRRHEVLRFHAGEFRFHPASALQSMRMAVPTTLLQCVVS